MDAPRSRYPGAVSFADDDVSRAVFFGREREIVALGDLVVAHRLVVVYARSGLGKSSLLNAGVAQPLREAGFVPLIVRVNEVSSDALPAIYDAVRRAAQRQGIEHLPGDTRSLWHFFKTAEFWSGDRLLTPVLVIDQCEELFTLQGEPARLALLGELGRLVRGVEPLVAAVPGAEPEPGTLSPAPPDVRLVLSLREDFLGALEEAADFLPTIMDHRFRLLPLTAEAARAAASAPARVEDENLRTRPFDIQPEAVDGILEFLKRSASAPGPRTARYVEPFQLQLVCQRMEALAQARQRVETGRVRITWAELGGEKGLRDTLRNFYADIVGSLRTRRLRRKVRSLCEQHLISPSGRRLSLEESEIERLFRLRRRDLQDLIDRRLLRADQRADSWYFELSHDSLIGPILASRRWSAIALGLSGLVTSMLVCLFAIGVILGVPVELVYVYLHPDPPGDAQVDFAYVAAVALLLGVPLGVMVWIFGQSTFRRSVDTLNRFVPPIR